MSVVKLTEGPEVETVDSEEFAFKPVLSIQLLEPFSGVPFCQQNLLQTNEKIMVCSSGDEQTINIIEMSSLRAQLEEFHLNKKDNGIEISEKVKFNLQFSVNEHIVYITLTKSSVIMVTQQGTLYNVPISKCLDAECWESASRQINPQKKVDISMCKILNGNELYVLYDDHELYRVNFQNDALSVSKVQSNVTYFDTFHQNKMCFATKESFHVGETDFQIDFDTEESTYSPIAIAFINETQLFCCYGNTVTLADKDDVSYDYKMYIVDIGHMSYSETFDVTPAFVNLLRKPIFYQVNLIEYIQKIPVVSILASSSSSELSIITVANDSAQISKVAVQLPIQDGDRAVLPMDEETDDDTTPVGIALDCWNNTINLDKELDEHAESVDTKQIPLVYVLNNKGVLQIFAFVYQPGVVSNNMNLSQTSSLLNWNDDFLFDSLPQEDSLSSIEQSNDNEKTPNTDSVPETQLAKGTADVDTTPTGAATSSPFGQASSTSNAATTTPQFSFSNIALDKTAAPAFGQAGFGAAANSVFGQAGFGAAASSTFGSTSSGTNTVPGFGQLGFGTSSQSSSGFGAPASVPIASGSAFGKPAFPAAASPFGSVAPAGSAASPFGSAVPAGSAASPFGSAVPAGSAASPFGSAVPAGSAASPFGSVALAGSTASPFGLAVPGKGLFGSFDKNNKNESKSEPSFDMASFGKSISTPLDNVPDYNKNFADSFKGDPDALFGNASAATVTESPFAKFASSSSNDSKIAGFTAVNTNTQLQNVEKTAHADSETSVNDTSLTTATTHKASDNEETDKTDNVQQTNDSVDISSEIEDSSINDTSLLDEKFKEALLKSNELEASKRKPFSFGGSTSLINSSGGDKSKFSFATSAPLLDSDHTKENEKFSSRLDVSASTEPLEEHKDSSPFGDFKDFVKKPMEKSQSFIFKQGLNNDLESKGSTTEETKPKKYVIENTEQEEGLTGSTESLERDEDPADETSDFTQDHADLDEESNESDSQSEDDSSDILARSDVVEDAEVDNASEDNETENEPEITESIQESESKLTTQELPADSVQVDDDWVDVEADADTHALERTKTLESVPVSGTAQVVSKTTLTEDATKSISSNTELPPVVVKSTQATVETASASTQTIAVLTKDESAFAFLDEEEYLNQAYTPVPLEKYVLASYSQSTKNKYDSEVLNILNTLACTVDNEMIALSRNIKNLDSYFQDQVKTTFVKTEKCLNPDFYWRMNELPDLHKLVNYKCDSDTISDLSSQVTLLSKEDFASSSASLEETYDLLKIQIANNNAQIDALPVSQMRVKLSIEKKFHTMKIKLERISELMKVLKLYSLLEDHQSKGSSVKEYMSSLPDRNSLLDEIRNLRREVGELKIESHGSISSSVLDIGLQDNIAKSSTERMSGIVELSMKFKSKRVLGDILKNRTL